jgi:broad specificity phosphatase PhoE
VAELIVIRHGQASFGAANYDKLSDLGHVQSALVGEALKTRGWVPDRVVIGGQVRHRETLEGMGYADGEIEVDAGFNEYDFHDLLLARYDGKVPDLILGDRKTHFRTLRETVFEWQADTLPNASESWLEFTTRIENALTKATREGAEKILVVSSGGVIGQITADTVGGPAKMMMTLNLQIKNTAINKFIVSGPKRFLHEFNATPHLDVPDHADKLTYS